MSETLTITPDMHRRAIQVLAEIVLEASNDLGYVASKRAELREKWNMEPNPAHAVSEAAAQMGASLAKKIAAGEIVPFMDEVPE